MKRILITTVFVAIGVTLLSWVPFSDTNNLTHVPKPTKHVVEIIHMKFVPQELVVKNGDIVVWINKDFVPHDVTADDKKWTSGPLLQDKSWSKVITTNENYFCNIHKVMKGSIRGADK